jgi:VWFA-related protein
MLRIGNCKNVILNRQVRFAFLTLTLLIAHPLGNTLAQKQKSQSLEQKLNEPPQEPSDDVLRISTDLVQTSVAVFDKRGKFVDNLGPENFELYVDEKPHALLFFERVINGIRDPLKSDSTARQAQQSQKLANAESAGRLVLFFVDDLHLSAESITRSRNMLLNYIEKQMGESDQAIIASPCGQIGFLQQLADDKDVLRAAVERLKYRPTPMQDTDRPTMSVYQALAIERNDESVLKYFENVLLSSVLAAQAKINPRMARDAAERMTRSRAGRIVRQADFTITQTLASLNSFVRSSAQVPGRKVVVFISDGFLVNPQHPDARNRLQRITDAAARTGAVIYAIQASGLTTSFPDASSDAVSLDGDTGRLMGEDIASQDPLTELAADTGGRALLNANDLNRSMANALKESNDYYLLAWRPDTELLQQKGFHHIRVGIKGHPDLTVMVNRGLFSEERPAVVNARAQAQKPQGSSLIDELAAAIRGSVGNDRLKTYLTVNYMDAPKRGGYLSILMQMQTPVSAANDQRSVAFDVAGVVYDDSGKVTGSFVNRLNAADPKAENITYLDELNIKPGLYQVRVAARDERGRIGTATQWIKVPNLSSHQLALSSLLIGERDAAGTATASNKVQSQKAQLRVDRRFATASRLRFLTYVYNAARSAGSASPQLEVHFEIFHNNQTIVSTTPRKIETTGIDDLDRIPYAGELSLFSMPRGHSILRVTVTDRVAGRSASQQVAIEIE